MNVSQKMEHSGSSASANATESDVLAALREAAVLAGLEDRILRSLAAISKVATYEAGARVFGQAEAEVPFVILLSGQISLYRTAPDGTVTVIEVVHAPGHAALQSVLTQLPTLIGADVVSAAQVVTIDGAGLRALLPLEPPLAALLLRAEALAFRAMVLQVCDLKLRTTAQRLGHYLLELAPDRHGASATVKLPFDKRLLAARLGCRQENLSRAFATLREIGVETRGARVTMHDIPRLRDYAVTFDEPETA